MRIRKILPLALLAIGTLFALTSCDKLLDAIFASNTINVTVKVAWSDHLSYASGGYVGVVVTGSDSSVYSATAYSTFVDGSGYVNYGFSFPKLGDATYGIATTYYGPATGTTYTNAFYDPTNYYGTSITLPYIYGGSETSVSVISVLN